ncbi:ribonuclease H, partial [Trifolium pratense]
SIPSIHPRQVSWSRPAEGTICLNVDGSLLGSPQTAGFGGLIRNNVGAFLEGFYGTASQSNILYVEIMAVLHGLELCWNKGFRDVVCFSDSLLTVKLIKEGVSNCHSLANEVHIIRQLLGRVWRVVIDHTLREDNKCADLLAKLGASANSPLVLLTVPHTELLNLIDPDVRGVIFIRE